MAVGGGANEMYMVSTIVNVCAGNTLQEVLNLLNIFLQKKKNRRISKFRKQGIIYRELLKYISGIKQIIKFIIFLQSESSSIVTLYNLCSNFQRETNNLLHQ